jgi:hypothetical protein
MKEGYQENKERYMPEAVEIRKGIRKTRNCTCRQKNASSLEMKTRYY